MVGAVAPGITTGNISVMCARALALLSSASHVSSAQGATEREITVKSISVRRVLHVGVLGLETFLHIEMEKD